MAPAGPPDDLPRLGDPHDDPGFAIELLDHAADVIIALDLDLRLREISQRGVELSGRSREELIGMPLSELIEPQYLEIFRTKLEEKLSGQATETRYEVEIAARGEAPRWFEVVSWLRRDRGGRPFGLGAIARDISQRRAAEEALAASEERYRTLAEASPDAIFVVDAGGFYRFANPAAARFVGRSIEEMLGRRGEEWFPPGLAARHRESVRRVIATGEPFSGESQVPLAQGSGWFDTRLVPIHSETGIVAVLGIARDITERKAAESRLQLWSKVFENANEGILITDAEGKVLSVNGAFSRITGYEAPEIIGGSIAKLRSGRHPDEFFAEFWRTLASSGSWSGEIWNRRKNGEVYPEWLSVSAIRDPSGTITHFLGIFSDISERKASEERIERLAHYDPLTELPNRTLLADRLAQAILAAQRSKRKVAVLFLDLDRFKWVNDRFGHAVGDQLLQQVARRIRGVVRDGDTVARVGGDEFVLALPELRDTEDAARVAQKCLDAMVAPFRVGEREFAVSVAIGITVFPDDGDDQTQLLRDADQAMYQAKQAGRNSYQFASAGLNVRAFEVLLLERELSSALAGEDFRLLYQPQLDLASGRIIGFEAMLRWQHSHFGVLPAGLFIEVAEERGLAPAISDWMLAAACRTVAGWRRAGHGRAVISANLPASQLARADLPERVAALLAEHRLPAEALEFELAERMLHGEATAAVKVLRGLGELGVSLAVDDFGTGCSSLCQLLELPIRKLKVDPALVRGLGPSDGSRRGLRAVLSVARELGLTAVAEGVEESGQLEVLRAERCAAAQGYLLGVPMSEERARELLESDEPPR